MPPLHVDKMTSTGTTTPVRRRSFTEIELREFTQSSVLSRRSEHSNNSPSNSSTTSRSSSSSCHGSLRSNSSSLDSMVEIVDWQNHSHSYHHNGEHDDNDDGQDRNALLPGRSGDVDNLIMGDSSKSRSRPLFQRFMRNSTHTVRNWMIQKTTRDANTYNHHEQQQPQPHEQEQQNKRRIIKRIVLCLLVLWAVLQLSYYRKQSHSSALNVGSERITPTNYTLYRNEKLGVTVQDGFTHINPSILKKILQDSNTEWEEDNECVPIIPNYDTLYPSCNQMHEFGIEDMLATQDFKFLGNGGIRGVWKIKSDGVGREEVMVMKMLRLPFPHIGAWEDELEAGLMETNVMSETTKSPHIMNVYGMCGNSAFNEFGGVNAENYVKENKLTSMQKLQFAKDAAQAVADLHATLFVHKDLRPNNFLVVDGVVKLNDFNRGNFLRWNVTDGSPCGSNPKRCYRLTSPEECRKDTENSLPTEKADVFQLGNFFYFLVTELKYPFGWFADFAYVPAMKHMPKIMKPKHHVLYQAMEYSRDPAIIAIREAMRKCHRSHPKHRASAQEVADDLAYAYSKLFSSSSHT